MTSDETNLIHKYLDGSINADELAQLETLLRGDKEARVMLRSLATIDAKWQQIAVQNPADKFTAPNRDRPHIEQKRWWQWRSLAAAAAGLAIGLSGASAAWAVVVPKWSVQIRSLLTESFEGDNVQLQERFPTTPDTWGGDPAEIISSDSADEGDHVLQFGPNQKRKYSYINRLVDVAELQDYQVGTQKELRLSVSIRTIKPTVEAQRFSLRLAAFIESPNAVRSIWHAGEDVNERTLGFTSRSRVVKDNSNNEWTRLEVTMRLPAESRCVVMSIGAATAHEERSVVGYDIDNVRLELISQPSTNLN